MRNIKQQWLNFFNMNLDMHQDLIHKVHYLNLERNSLKLNIPLKTFTLKHIFSNKMQHINEKQFSYNKMFYLECWSSHPSKLNQQTTHCNSFSDKNTLQLFQ